MKDTPTTPITVLKRRTPYITHLHRTNSTSSSASSLSYPKIPSRRSSLSASVEYDSSDPAASTRTPSLSDSLYNIDVVKIRQGHAAAPRGIRKAGLDVNEDPFIDQASRRRVYHQRGLMTQSGYQLAPQLLVRWSSGSYGSIEPCLSSKSASASGAIEPPPDSIPKHKSRVHSGRSLSNILRPGSSGLLCPLELPITFASVRSYTGWPSTSTDSMSVWTSVNVSADVEPIFLPDSSSLAPLDVIILFDSLRQASVSLLTPMVLASSVFTSNLLINSDRIGVAWVDGSSKNGLEVFLPLGFHPFETLRTALNEFSLRQLKKTRRCSDAGNSIQHASRLFRPSPRAAFCHLVFISACPPENLFISGVDPAIGWHIFYDADAEDPRSCEVHFMRKVSKVVRQLRTGLSPGALSDLKLFFEQGHGCRFESAIEDCHLARLRPGETWILKAKIGVPMDFYQDTQLTEHPMLEDLICQINSVLKAYSSEPAAQHVLSARLEHQHSLLPKPHTICLETHCTISRTPGVPPCPSDDHRQVSALMSYELDNDPFSVSLGSSSELS
ncbi:Ubiquitin-conjugating enzyme, E2 [Penicillium digitatum]|uniref:Ubiquitin-conjugating enzyme, E2 n=1 Tax=Penicillium digitatum TaxID=36651 RepID=A0A7T6XJ38_PENDI|nr:Ubiquitin-conjugating enzyme, E2 [Penicillium digitatum]